MTTRSRRRRVLNLAIVAILGVAIGFASFVGLQILSRPGPRDAPGWELLAEMPNGRGETAVAVADSRVYVAGGFTGLAFETTAEVSVYDAAADLWSAGPGLPEARNHAAAVAVDGAVYISGGTSGLTGGPKDTVWLLAPGATTWTSLAPMPGPRSAHRIVALDGRLYVVGGVGGAVDGEGAAGRVLIYDLEAAAWSAGAAMPLVRDHLAAVVVGHEIWAIGGRAGGQNHARVDIYDPATDTWRDGPALPEGTSGAAEAVVGAMLLVSGGEDPGRGVIVDRHWRLDTVDPAPAWAPVVPPPLAIHGVGGAVVDNRFLVIGGSTRPGAESNTGWTGAVQAFSVPPR